MTVIVGILLGIGGILLGNALEGGHVSSLIQGTAFFIVMGGTAGAVLVANRREDIAIGLRLLRRAIAGGSDNEDLLAKQVVEAAQLARRESILALEAKLPQMPNEHMRNVFRFMIDGVEPETLREIFRTEADQEERRLLAGAKIWQDAGGYSPTIGIIGAVLGLIHVMANLTDTSELGKGIAVAFVATIYGVGFANLIFLPISNRLTRMIRRETQIKLMVVEGAVAIVSGLNPYIIDEKLSAFVPSTQEGSL